MGFCADEDSDCIRTEHRVSLAEVQEVQEGGLLSGRRLEISTDAQEKLLDVE